MTLLTFGVGLIVGLVLKGVHIHIHQTVDKPVDKQGKPQYNESLAGMLPKDVQQYYHETQGQNRF